MEGDFDYPELEKIILTVVIVFSLLVGIVAGVWLKKPEIVTETVTEEVKVPLYALVDMKLDDLLSSNVFEHTNSDGKTLEKRRMSVGIQSGVGEVLAKDYCTLDKAVEAWMKSPTHKDVITDTNYNHVVLRMERNDKHCYWVGEYIK